MLLKTANQTWSGAKSWQSGQMLLYTITSSGGLITYSKLEDNQAFVANIFA